MMLRRKLYAVKYYVDGLYKQGVFTASGDEEIKSLLQVKYGSKLHNIHVMDKKEISLLEASIIMEKPIELEE